MSNPNSPLMSEIEAFLSDTGMGASYFGKVSTGNSELVSRLRAGRRIWPDTESKVRAFIRAERKTRSKASPSRAPAEAGTL